MTITLEVTHPDKAGLIEGFRFIWAFYVNGYWPDRHCQPGLKGRRVEAFCTGRAATGTLALDRMDRYPYVYVCGVASAPRSELRLKNLHMPLAFREGHTEVLTSYNGYEFKARDAVKLEIPPLPAGWNGIQNLEHTRCKNFQFAVSVFGYPPPDRK
jgi:hypothetical protein